MKKLFKGDIVYVCTNGNRILSWDRNFLPSPDREKRIAALWFLSELAHSTNAFRRSPGREAKRKLKLFYGCRFIPKASRTIWRRS